MYCKHCGQKLEENSKFCPSCGINQQENNTIVANTDKGAWKVFATIGYVMGIVSLSTCFIFEYSMSLSVIGIIFSALGKKSINNKDQAKIGLKLSIIACSLNVAISILISLLVIFIYIVTVLLALFFNINIFEIFQSYM